MKWEYKIIEMPPVKWREFDCDRVVPTLDEKQLNELGLAGWEMCGLTPAIEAEFTCASVIGRFYFKRPFAPLYV